MSNDNSVTTAAAAAAAVIAIWICHRCAADWQSATACVLKTVVSVRHAVCDRTSACKYITIDERWSLQKTPTVTMHKINVICTFKRIELLPPIPLVLMLFSPLFFCLSICEQHNSKNYGWVFVKFERLVNYGSEIRLLNFIKFY